MTSSGSDRSPCSVIVDPLAPEHLVLRRLDVGQEPRQGRPEEEAEGGQSHEDGHRELRGHERDQLLHQRPSPCMPLWKRTRVLGAASAGADGSSARRELAYVSPPASFRRARVAGSSFSFSPVSGSLNAENDST